MIYRMAACLTAGLLALTAACAPAHTPPQTEESARQATAVIDWGAVERAMDRSGSMQPGGVFKFAIPRSDLHAGDLVLTEAEYNRVITRLQEGGITQTAIHKHLLDESPRIWWTYIQAEGDPVRIAESLRAALALTGTPA